MIFDALVQGNQSHVEMLISVQVANCLVTVISSLCVHLSLNSFIPAGCSDNNLDICELCGLNNPSLSFECVNVDLVCGVITVVNTFVNVNNELGNWSICVRQNAV